MDILKIFDELYRAYGPQGWWPTTRYAGRAQSEKRKMQRLLPPPLRLPLRQGEKAVPQYYPGKYGRRLSENEKFEIAIGAILTQNTAWKNVEKAIVCLHREGLMSPQAILNAPIDTLRRCIKSSGYYKQKTKKVRIFCRWLVKKHGGELGEFFEQKNIPSPSEPREEGEGQGEGRSPLRFHPLPCPLPVRGAHRARGKIDTLRRELLSLWGIGPETADSILLYAGGLPVFVVDAYTRRLCQKHGVRFKKYEDYQRFFEQGLAGGILQLPRLRSVAQDDRIKRSHRPLTPTLSLKTGRGRMTVLYQEYHALIVQWGKEYGLSH